jgi:site-specific recombinase XerD
MTHLAQKQTYLRDHLEVRNGRFYARLNIPDAVRPILQRLKYRKALGTSDRSEARRLAPELVAKWQRQIEDARAGIIRKADANERSALDLLGRLRRARTDAERAVVQSEIDFVFEHLAEDADGAVRGTDDPIPTASRFYGLATGQHIPLLQELEPYLSTLKGKREAKTVDMKRSTITKFAKGFTYVRDVQRRDAQEHIDDLAANGAAVATIRRVLSELRGYWKYLRSIEVVSDGPTPFDSLHIAEEGKSKRHVGRKPFSPKQLTDLVSEARKLKDQHLVDLIDLARYSGARREELCALKLDKVHKDHFQIEDAKTEAGWRDVPIHSRLAATVERLRQDSKDGYLLRGLGSDRYGDRGDAIGKRFTRLKQSMKLGKHLVFHSIRHCVVDQLKNAGVAETVAADIVGHERPTMTFGTYGDVTPLKVKRAAIEKLKYPSTQTRKSGR